MVAAVASTLPGTVVVDPAGLSVSNVGLDGHEVPRVTHATANDGSVAAGTLCVPGVHAILMLVVCYLPSQSPRRSFLRRPPSRYFRGSVITR